VLVALEVRKLVFIPDNDPPLVGARDCAVGLVFPQGVLLLACVRAHRNKAGHGNLFVSRLFLVGTRDRLGVHVNASVFIVLQFPVPENDELLVVGDELERIVLVKLDLELVLELFVLYRVLNEREVVAFEVVNLERVMWLSG